MSQPESGPLGAPTMRVGVVINEGKSLGGGLEALRSTLADLGHADPPWYEVSRSKKAPKAIRKMAGGRRRRPRPRRGGDGTVRRAINTVIDDGLDVAIGILAGTANLLANNLDIPIDLGGAVDVAVHGEPRAIDVGEMNGTYFAVMAGAGFDALMIRDADDSALKDRYGRLGYVVAGVRNRDVSPAKAVSKSMDSRGTTVTPAASSSRTSARSSAVSERSPMPRQSTVGSTWALSRRVRRPTGPARVGQRGAETNGEVTAHEGGHCAQAQDHVRPVAAVGGGRRRP